MDNICNDVFRQFYYAMRQNGCASVGTYLTFIKSKKGICNIIYVSTHSRISVCFPVNRFTLGLCDNRAKPIPR